MEVTETDDWSWSFTNLAKYRDQGTEIIYTITEEAVEGYQTTINGYDVTNTHTPKVVEMNVTNTDTKPAAQTGDNTSIAGLVVVMVLAVVVIAVVAYRRFRKKA